jgi:hypothetical protein
MDAWFQAILPTVLGGCEWEASRSSLFTLGERNRGTNWIANSLGPRVGLDAGTGAHTTYYSVDHLLNIFRLLIFG